MLLDRAIRFLDERGSASSAELARHVFGGDAFTPMLTSLDSDRLVFDGQAWRLRPPVEDSALLEVLTTGPNPTRHRVVEVAAERGSRRFHALLASRKPLPKLLLRFGVPDDPDEQQPPEEVASELRTFLSGATVVGLGYVPAFLDQLLGPHWPAVDLLRLVQATDFTGRPDPARLARHFDLQPPLNRRPLAMLGFSAALFERLRGQRSLAELREAGEPRPFVMPVAPPLPNQPGVYVMAEQAGRPLYVGKSVDLKRRVSSYLQSPIVLSRNMHDLMQLTDRIELIPVNTELEALLLEGQLIREWQPPFNIQRQSHPRRRYLRLSVHEPFPRLTLAWEPAPDGAVYFGPLRHATAAARLHTLLASLLRLRTCTRSLPSHRKPAPPCPKAASGECLAPCLIGPAPYPYGAEVELARRLLSADPDTFRRELRCLLRERPPAPAQALRLKRRVLAVASHD